MIGGLLILVILLSIGVVLIQRRQLKTAHHQFIRSLLINQYSKLYLLSPSQIDGYLANQESRYHDIVKGANSQVHWFNGQQQTEVVVLFLHGFSATNQELSPLPEQLATNLKANLVLPRLSGHGRHAQSMKKVQFWHWLQDTWVALQLASVLGKKIILVGNSTGASLINWMLQQPILLKQLPSKVVASIQISPNFAIKHPFVFLLKLPMMRLLLDFFYKKNHSVQIVNSQHLKYWTTSYPLQSVISLQLLLRWLNLSKLGHIFTPTLFIYNEFDTVVDPKAIARAIDQFGAFTKSVDKWRIKQPNQSKHVLAGDIFAKQNTVILLKKMQDFVQPIIASVILQSRTSMRFNRRQQDQLGSKGQCASRYDVVVMGAGINGIAVALQARLQGFSVLLLESNDLASGTSNASTKLIHGGLRYLQQGKIKMVRKALQERRSLFEISPYLIRPIRITIPIHSLWQRFKLHIGLWLYDHLAPVAVSHVSRYIPHLTDPVLKPGFTRAFSFIDGQTDDVRLVLQLAKTAAQAGVHIKTHCYANEVSRTNGWEVHWYDRCQKQELKVRCRTVINCTGPNADQWYEQFMQMHFQQANKYSLRLVKGSHILIKQISKQAYLFPLAQSRVLFVLPFAGLTMIGTTEQLIETGQSIKIQQQELTYLLDKANLFLKTSITKKEVLFSFSGVRPLLESNDVNNSQLSRDYHIQSLSAEDAQLINVYGGKLTTFRQLAYAVVSQLQMVEEFKGLRPIEHVVGGSMPPYALEATLSHIAPYLSPEEISRLIHSYGEVCLDWFTNKAESQLGVCFAPGVYQVEIDYLIKHEWVSCSDDLLLRRSRFTWQLGKAQQRLISDYINQQLA